MLHLADAHEHAIDRRIALFARHQPMNRLEVGRHQRSRQRGGLAVLRPRSQPASGQLLRAILDRLLRRGRGAFDRRPASSPSADWIRYVLSDTACSRPRKGELGPASFPSASMACAAFENGTSSRSLSTPSQVVDVVPLVEIDHVRGEPRRACRGPPPSPHTQSSAANCSTTSGNPAARPSPGTLARLYKLGTGSLKLTPLFRRMTSSTPIPAARSSRTARATSLCSCASGGRR